MMVHMKSSPSLITNQKAASAALDAEVVCAKCGTRAARTCHGTIAAHGSPLCEFSDTTGFTASADPAPPAHTPGPLIDLECCCCGSSTTGRQWWNRDTGYGLCDDCIDHVGAGSVPVGGTAESYGVRGVHFGIDRLIASAPALAARVARLEAALTRISESASEGAAHIALDALTK